MARYWYLVRPGGYAQQPDGWTDMDSFCPSRSTPEADGLYTYGWVEYSEPLDFETIDHWSFRPADPQERARYAFWQEADRDEAQMQWLLDDYLGADAEHLRTMIARGNDSNGLCAAALALKGEKGHDA